VSTSDSIELLSRIAPVSDEDAAGLFGELGRERLLDGIVRLPRRQRPVRRRLRRPVVLALAVLAVAAATGAGWALTHGPARETTSVDCLIHGQTSVIEATSGDPAADCAAIWPAPVPTLQAYDDGLGGVVVIPASEKPQATWTPISSQDLALIELQDSLDDHIEGLGSACFDASQATSFAQQQLDRLGFAGWTVRVRPTSEPGPLCYSASVADPVAKSVTLIAMGNQAGLANWPPREFAESLRPLTQECLSLPAMENAIEQQAASLGMSQTVENVHNYELKATEDDTMRCATVYADVAGTTDVVVRGPAHVSP
jgi:hypothetical protein